MSKKIDLDNVLADMGVKPDTIREKAKNYGLNLMRECGWSLKEGDLKSILWGYADGWKDSMASK